MFGKNKENQKELEKLKKTLLRDDAFFESVGEKKEMYGATAAEMEESRHQADVGMEQIRQNLANASELAAGNVEIEKNFTESLQALARKADGMAGEHKKVTEHFYDIQEKITDLVDANKHFTSPSKYLNEAPEKLRSRNRDTGRQLDLMEEYNKQMGVLALDAAIEAGRLGDSGKQFVASAEAIRSYASHYDEVIGKAREQLADAEEEVQRLEEEVHRLVSLLKENNIVTAKLMKSCGDVVKEAEKAREASIDEDLELLMNQVTILRNADDEIVKSEERNRMQLEDLAEELDAQMKNQNELAKMADPFFRYMEERKSAPEE